MIHWKETAEVLARLAALEAAGRRAALATVVRIVGSAYRRPGAKLLVEEGGGTLGSVSGGCLEADVREVAQAVLGSGKPTLRHYVSSADEDVVWGLGLGCDGLVDVLVQPASEGPLAGLAVRLRELLAGDAPFALATLVDDGEDLGTNLLVDSTGTVHGSLGSADLDAHAAKLSSPAQILAEPSDGLRDPRGRPPERATDPGARVRSAQDDGAKGVARTALEGPRSGVHDIAGRTVFVDVFRPPPHLVVCGAGDDAVPLVAYAADAGFCVTVADHRPALLQPARFPRAARLLLARPGERDIALPPAARSLAVVKAHSLVHDREWVRRLLAAGFPYVGVLGPRERTATILGEIGAAGEERVFGPVGLDLGADGPWQVAMSIVAELLAVTARREPRHLAARQEAIHAG